MLCWDCLLDVLNSAQSYQLQCIVPKEAGVNLAIDCAETMSFAGLAPEIINGRGAMIGMLAAFGAELRTHTAVLQQVLFSVQAPVSGQHLSSMCEPTWCAVKAAGG